MAKAYLSTACLWHTTAYAIGAYIQETYLAKSVLSALGNHWKNGVNKITSRSYRELAYMWWLNAWEILQSLLQIILNLLKP